MRHLDKTSWESPNPVYSWWKVKNPLIVGINFLVSYLARFNPFMPLKNLFYRLIGIKLGKSVGISPTVVFDFYYPELIEIGDNSIIGWDTVILAHEFMVDEIRKGQVRIGKNVMIGSSCLILPGVTIGDRATVSSFSLVNKDVPAGARVGGVPIKPLGKGK